MVCLELINESQAMIQKIYWHGVAILKIILYKMMFGKGLVFPLSSTFRERFNLTIVNGGGYFLQGYDWKERVL